MPRDKSARPGMSEARRLRAYKALDLRCAGARYKQIGEQLGVSHVQAFSDVRLALKECASEHREQADALRALELQRLDKMTLALWPKLANGDEKVARTLVAISERRCRLLGIDAPLKGSLQVDVNHRTVHEYYDTTGVLVETKETKALPPKVN